jgi:hypothetical protein
MTDRERYKCVYQIIAGGCECIVGDRTLTFQQPSAVETYKAEEIYDSTFRRASLLGIMDGDGALHRLLDMNLWTIEKQQKLDETPDKIENAKLRLYNNYVAFKPTDRIRNELAHHRKVLDDLSDKRGVLDSYTAESLASFARNQYLACVGYGIDFFNDDYAIILKASEAFMKSIIAEDIIRMLARTDPWRTLWHTAKDGSQLFGAPAANFTVNQRALVSWAKFFDSIHESMECPENDIIDDDDLLDGWLLSQKQKREEDRHFCAGAVVRRCGTSRRHEYYTSQDIQEASLRYCEKAGRCK